MLMLLAAVSCRVSYVFPAAGMLLVGGMVSIVGIVNIFRASYIPLLKRC